MNNTPGPGASTLSPEKAMPSSGSRAAQALLHRAIFRLHFYAGLIVAPFVLILSLTGAIYLFVTEIQDIENPSWRFMQAHGAAPAA